MDFESPDVEKDFPGLYASESTKKTQSRDSDYSDEEKSSRKDILGKRKDKKESKKDKGYVAFEGESSGDDADETKSPSKSKKNKSAFKFTRQKNCTQEKKDKHTKVKEKEGKEKREDKEKICKKENKDCKKDKDKELEKGKVKSRILKEHKLLKIKDRKKKSTNQTVTEELPIFGVPLQVAVERSKSHDGIEIPVVVRECIDYIEEHGLACEGIYRISGVKSKLRQLKMQYNRGEKVYLYEHEPHIVASLLKQFLRDLPESVLTSELMPKFEEAAAMKNEQKKVETLEKLLDELPKCNRLILSWIFIHMFHVINLEKRNKMNLQNVSIVLSPTMQISHRVLHALFAHSGRLFRGYEIKKYVPPIELDSSRLSLELPDSPTAIEEELNKQENALNKLHAELNTGLRDLQKEEQLWEIQRVVTQLKRKFRFLRQVKDATKPTDEITPIVSTELSQNENFCLNSAIEHSKVSYLPSVSQPSAEKSDSEMKSEICEVSSDLEVENVQESQKILQQEEKQLQNLETNTPEIKNVESNIVLKDEKKTLTPSPDLKKSESEKCNDGESVDDVDNLLPLLQEETLLQIQRDELMLLGDELKRKINSEKLEIERLGLEINEYQQLYKYKQYSFDSTENSSFDSDDSSESNYDDDEFSTVLVDLMKENKQLEEKNTELSKEIQREREICLNIKVQMKMLQTDTRNVRS